MKADPMQASSCLLTSPAASQRSPLELDGYLTGIIVAPQAAPIPPSRWMAELWGEAEPLFEDKARIGRVHRAIMTHYDGLLRDIDRSLDRWQADRVVDFRPMFLVGDEKPRHDAVRVWARGLWKAMQLAPEAWHELTEDQRTRVIMTAFVGFFDIGELEPHEICDDVDERLDQAAAQIPRMILMLRKVARSRETAARRASAVRVLGPKIGRNDPCRCGSGKKYKHCCAIA
ncbi:UPF0149 family protein [Bradyrhizobium sp.]|uniref:YecA/YgfB family protein n=1 Tax=Bradyrhizobium sp. TaxID=376 RepID=UPI003C499C96